MKDLDQPRYMRAVPSSPSFYTTSGGTIISMTQGDGGTVYNSPAADGDVITIYVWADGGETILWIGGNTYINHGKYEVRIDGVLIETVDQYSGTGPIYGTHNTTITPAVARGWHTVTLTVNGKNASSLGYLVVMSEVGFRPA